LREEREREKCRSAARDTLDNIVQHEIESSENNMKSETETDFDKSRKSEKPVNIQI